MTQISQNQSPLKLSLEQPEGLEIEEGRFKTSQGTIVIPKSRQKALAREAAKKEQKEIKHTPMNAFPEREVSTKLPEIKTGKVEKVTFKTPVGTFSASYNPVIELEDWVVLGLMPQAFVPTSYKENKDLVLEISSPSIKSCKVVFTGCQFTDPFTRAKYIILMKV